MENERTYFKFIWVKLIFKNNGWMMDLVQKITHSHKKDFQKLQGNS